MSSRRTQEEVVYHQETQSERLKRKSEQAPFFPIAIGVCTLFVAYGIYAFKNRGKMSPSVYLMHLRVGAQGAAVGSLTLGLLYTMIKNHFALNPIGGRRSGEPATNKQG